MRRGFFLRRGRILLVGALLAAWPAAADYRNRHGDWWVECYARDSGPFGYTCASRTTSRDGLQLYVVERQGQPFIVVHAEAGIQFDRSQHLNLRVDTRERFSILAQQRRVAYLAGNDALRLIGGMVEGDLVFVTYNDLFGQARDSRFGLDGFGPAYKELKQAMAEAEQGAAQYQRPPLPPSPDSPAPPPSAQQDPKRGEDTNVVDDVVNDVGDFFGRVGRFIGRQFER